MRYLSIAYGPLSRGLELGVSILIADCARVLLMTYPVRTYDPSTTSRHFGAETKTDNYVVVHVLDLLSK